LNAGANRTAQRNARTGEKVIFSYSEQGAKSPPARRGEDHSSGGAKPAVRSRQKSGARREGKTPHPDILGNEEIGRRVTISYRGGSDMGEKPRCKKELKLDPSRK